MNYAEGKKYKAMGMKLLKALVNIKEQACEACPEVPGRKGPVVEHTDECMDVQRVIEEAKSVFGKVK